jgi:hypothetical protein
MASANTGDEQHGGASSSSWATIIDEISAERPSGDAAIFRVVLVGRFGAGKRTLCARMREALSATGDRAPAAGGAAGAARSGGIDHHYVDVRRGDGALSHTVEFLCVDVEALLPIALPTADLMARTAVLFVSDLGDTPAIEADIAGWVAAVNTHVAATVGADATEGLLAAVDERTAAGRAQFSRYAPDVAAEESAGSADAAAAKCLLPSIVVANKMDLAARLAGLDAVGSAKLEARLFLHQVLRRTALGLGAGLALAQPARGGSASDAFHHALATYAVDAAMRGAGGAGYDAEAVGGSIGYEFEAHRLIPAGVDDANALSPVVRFRMTQFGAVFSAAAEEMPVIASHQEVLAGIKKPVANDSQGDDWNFLDH